jgi:hypothetical protein
VSYTVAGNSTTSGTDLHISGADGAQTRITQDALGTGTYVAFTGRSGRGTAAAPTQTQSGDTLAQFTGRGFSNGTLQFGNSSTGRLDMVAAEAFTDTSRATNVQIFTTATAAITPTAIATFSSAAGLSVAGNVTGGNILTAGIMSSTGNITGGNISVGVAASAVLTVKAGTASAGTAPVKLTSGTVLTTAEAGAVEYDGSFFYATPQTTNGRQVISTPSYYVLSANAAAVGSTIANFFPGTTSIPLVASGVYEIEFNCWFQKTTAGTLVWTLVNSTTVTQMQADLAMSPIAGVTSTAAASELFAQVAQQTAASVAFAATGSLTTAVNHFMRMRVSLVNGASTSLRLQVTNSAGTVTPLAGSYWRATRIASVGTLAA